MLNVTMKIRTTNVPDNLQHKPRSVEIEELPNYLEVSMVGTSQLALINIGSQTPNPDNSQYPWLKLDANGNPVGWYVYANGVWTKVPLAP